MFKNGQSCVAAKRYILVGKVRGAKFLDAVKAQLAGLRAGALDDPANTLSPVASYRALTPVWNKFSCLRTVVRRLRWEEQVWTAQGST